MKVVFVNPFFYPFAGGIENYMLDLGKYLVEKGHEVTVITSLEEGLKEKDEVYGIKVIRLKSIIIRNLPSLLPPPYSHPLFFSVKGYLALKKEEPDIVHVHNRYFPEFYWVILHKKLLKFPLVLTIHNSKPEKGGINPQTEVLARAYDDFFGNILMRSCDFILANSKYSLKVTVPPDYDFSRTGVAYNGIYTKKWKKIKCRRSSDADEVILTDARMVPQKGLDYLIKALPLLEFDYELIIKTIKGKNPEEKKLMQLAEKLGVRDKIKVVKERLSEDEMIRLYSSADQFVLPSLHEPFGIALIQAMATELPVTATKVGGIPEVVSDTGILVEPRNEKQLAEAMNLYHHDKKFAKEKTKKARKRVEEVFDWTNTGRQVEKVYEKLIGERK